MTRALDNKTGSASLDTAERALGAVWWVYHELGDEGVLQMEKDTFERTPDALERASFFRSRMKEWGRTEIDPVGRELRDLIEMKFREMAIIDVNDQKWKERVFEECLQFTRAKYPAIAEKRLLSYAQALQTVALAILPIRELPIALSAFAILTDRKRRLPEEKERLKLEVILRDLKLNTTELKEVEGAMKKARARVGEADPIVSLLERLFSLKEGYWKGFVDWRHRLRRKKLPFVPRMLRELVDGLQNPSKFRLPRYPRGLTVESGSEARRLAARCAKATFPKIFPNKFYDAESVRSALRYQDKK